MFLTVKEISTKERTGFSLKQISFNLEQFRTLAIAGATGSGKSTLLKIIAGIASPASGAVYFEGERVKKVPEEKLIPGHPGIAYLSQHFELRNHYRMEELMDYANILSGKEAEHIYHICKVDHLMKRRSNEVSGGEKQRLALARLLVSSPRLLILDEPFSNLDMIHKNILKSVITQLSEELKITLIFVTHEPSDMLSLADEIIILNNGTLWQQGKPKEVYLHPVDEYAGALLGKYNLLPSKQLPENRNEDTQNNQHIFIRPEHIKISEKKVSGSSQATIQKISFMGNYYEIEVKWKNGHLLVFSHNASLNKGDKVYITFSHHNVLHTKDQTGYNAQ